MSMECHDVEDRITAYLDGDLDATTASALRGHLRGCDPCRQLAEDHARLAGVLADLPPPDPSPAMWHGVLARLADAETADARRSRWSLFGRSFWERLRQHLVPALALAAAATVAAVWAIKHSGDEAPVAALHLAPPVTVPEPVHPAPVQLPTTETRDVEVSLAAESQRIDQLYADTVTSLLGDVTEERAEWPASRRRAFDAELTRLQAAVDAVPAAGIPRAAVADEDPFDAREAATARREQRERAWQRLVAYLQRAAIGELEEARR